ncbi:hypothetical protein BJX68DRAFT_243419 [Aspergillus pseudodeflectus]|uniref:Uncharacterized protein n=1 Tax=Aspergillus pseudodeflectus TaxID=176178 RepID=A0ABR4JW01_9EURO
MVETAAERLNRLQMEDLGTARREYISTVDRTRLRNTRVEVIEATRKSNLPGSTEQRIAGANKSRLEGWANVYKEIGDTGDLEGLDPLLNGQSHRLQLNDTIRQMKESSHVPSGRQFDGFAKTSQRIPSLQGPTTRSTSAAFRGPGPRPFEPKQLAARPASRTPQPGPGRPQSRISLDPALDLNNGVSKKTFKKQNSAGRSTSSAPNIPPLKTRRPIFNGPRAISSPEDFMAAARSNAAAKEAANRQPANSKSPSQFQSASSAVKPLPNSPFPVRKIESEDNGHSTLTNKPMPTDPDANLGSESSNPRKQKSSGDNGSSTLANQPKPTQPAISSRSPSSDTPREDSAETSVDQASQVKDEPHSKEPAVADQKVIPVTSVQESAELLLDLSCATPGELGLEPGMSPALVELQGLEFTQFTEPPETPISGIPSVNRRLDFGSTEAESTAAEIDEASSSPIDEELAAEYRREIDIICNLLEQTTLTDTFCSKLTECKEELELRLRLRRAPKSDVEHSEQLSTSKAPVSENPEISASATSENVARASGESSSPSTDTPRSQSRLNATAPQFTPQSFTQYRSISNATSTDSVGSFQPTPSKTSRQPQPEGAWSETSETQVSQLAIDRDSSQPRPESAPTDSTVIVSRVSDSSLSTHIFGDHLLPGGRTRKPIEIKRPEEAKQTEESHIIGDHLLPGRRATQPSTTKPGTHTVACSVLAHAAAPKPGHISFSLPPPQPKPAIQKIAVTAKSPNGSTLAPNAPAFKPSTLCLRPSNRAATTGPATDILKPAPAILESIHAPKPQPQATLVSAAPNNLSNGHGLQGSRYADAKWL